MECDANSVFFPGMGYASQMIIFYGSISYIVILAWAFLYFFSSFSGELPWASCNNTWNTGKVITYHEAFVFSTCTTNN